MTGQLRDIEAEYAALMERIVAYDAFKISAGPYLSNPTYGFDISAEGRVMVNDPNHERPQRLGNWVSQLAELSHFPYEPADVTELAIGVQERLTTEQGDFTTLMILSGIKDLRPTSGRKRKIT